MMRSATAAKMPMEILLKGLGRQPERFILAGNDDASSANAGISKFNIQHVKFKISRKQEPFMPGGLFADIENKADGKRGTGQWIKTWLDL